MGPTFSIVCASTWQFDKKKEKKDTCCCDYVQKVTAPLLTTVTACLCLCVFVGVTVSKCAPCDTFCELTQRQC